MESDGRNEGSAATDGVVAGAATRQDETPTGRAGRAQAASVSELVRSIAGDISHLVQKQVELAKQEIMEAAAVKARGVGALVVGAVLALFVIGFSGLAGAEALDLLLPRWAAVLIVAIVFLFAAIASFQLGRRWLREPVPQAERTKRALREDVEWAKRQLRRQEKSMRPETG